MTPFDRMLDSTLYVAADRARREQRPMAIEHCPTSWTVRDAAESTPNGYERITLVQPDQYTEEARMSIAKRLHTARIQGQHIAASLLDAFAGDPPLGGPAKPAALVGDLLPGAMVSHSLALNFATPELAPNGFTASQEAHPSPKETAATIIEELPAPAPASLPRPHQIEKVDGRDWAREIQDRLLSLPSVQRWIEEHGDLANLGQGLPCARDARRFVFPHLFDRFKTLIEERTEEAYVTPSAPDVELACSPAHGAEVESIEPEPTPTDLTPPWIEIAAQANTPTRRELALRRSGRKAQPRRQFDQSPHQQRLKIPDDRFEEISQAVAALQRYRDELERSRELGRKFGGGRRYVDDTRINLHDELHRNLPTLRKFVQDAIDNKVNPHMILRAIWSGQTIASEAVEHLVQVLPLLPKPSLPSEPEPSQTPMEGTAHPRPSVDQPVPIETDSNQAVKQAASGSGKRRGRSKVPAVGQGSLFD